MNGPSLTSLGNNSLCSPQHHCSAACCYPLVVIVRSSPFTQQPQGADLRVFREGFVCQASSSRGPRELTLTGHPGTLGLREGFTCLERRSTCAKNSGVRYVMLVVDMLHMSRPRVFWVLRIFPNLSYNKSRLEVEHTQRYRPVVLRGKDTARRSLGMNLRQKHERPL